MQRLKILVAVMSLLIIVGIGLLAWGIARLGTETPADATLALPAGSKIEHIAEVNGSLALHVRRGGKEFIHYFDPATGKMRGSLAVTQVAVTPASP